MTWKHILLVTVMGFPIAVVLLLLKAAVNRLLNKK